jgi:hypothetical protein
MAVGIYLLHAQGQRLLLYGNFFFRLRLRAGTQAQTQKCCHKNIKELSHRDILLVEFIDIITILNIPGF